MQIENEIQRNARSLDWDKRKHTLVSMKETELHVHLKELFSRMDTDSLVEVTHGTGELGKDLVIVKTGFLTTDVIGVVVKRGDIKGQTAGDVDDIAHRVDSVLSGASGAKMREISSQIKQARAHPAELASKFGRLPVTKVVVVLAGLLSGNARTRLENELGTDGDILDIQWLVDKFTSYYPQVFFEDRPVDFLQSRIMELETKGHMFGSDKNLTEYFVEPKLVAIASDSGSIDGVRSVMERSTSLSKLLAEAKTPRFVIVAGDPGTGKSAALAKVAIDGHRRAYRQFTSGSHGKRRVVIPVLVQAGDLLECDDVEALLRRVWDGAELRERFDINALLVDALDEIPSQDRAQTLLRARKFGDALNCSVVVTSRKIEAVGGLADGFERLDLLPFEISEALRLYQKLISSEQSMTALKDGLDKIKDQIPIIPLSLMLLIELVKEHKEIPSSVTELYDRFVDIVTGRYDFEKGIVSLFEHQVKKRFLASLAYKEFGSRDRLVISQQEFSEFVHVYAKEYGWQEESVPSFIAEIERSGLLSLNGDVEFSHRSFLEYFVASYIYLNSEDFDDLLGEICALHFSDLWDGVAFYYVGLKRTVPLPLLKRIFSHHTGNDEADTVKKFTAGRLLQAGWHSPRSTKQFGIENAFLLAPAIRQFILRGPQAEPHQLPIVMGDLVALMLSEYAFRSGFLQNELKEYFSELYARKDHPSTLAMLAVLWAVNSFLSRDEREEMVARCIEAFSNGDTVPVEDQGSALILLTLMQKGDRDALKAIKRRIKAFAKKHPREIQTLLPAQLPRPR